VSLNVHQLCITKECVYELTEPTPNILSVYFLTAFSIYSSLILAVKIMYFVCLWQLCYVIFFVVLRCEDD
jgi:hypothetical protein